MRGQRFRGPTEYRGPMRPRTRTRMRSSQEERGEGVATLEVEEGGVGRQDDDEPG